MAEHKMEQTASNKMFGGQMNRYKHKSEVCNCEMTFSVYVPEGKGPFPVLYFLSGLTCTDLNFVDKSGAQQFAAKYQVILVVNDTSPRGLGYPGEADTWSFGVGAGMYVDATQDPWKTGYRMYSYVTQELPAIIHSNFPTADKNRASIFGHSMGGHGALVIALKNPGKYKSVSAFAPISNPSVVPWGEFAIGKYLGDDKESWKAYDATELVKSYSGPKLNILIDQGDKDDFLENQLKPNNFVEAAKGNPNINVQFRMQEGYAHGYPFVSTFIEDHIRHHAQNCSL